MDPTSAWRSASAATATSATQPRALVHLLTTAPQTSSTPTLAIDAFGGDFKQELHQAHTSLSRAPGHESDENTSPTSRYKCSLSFILASTDADASARDGLAARPLVKLEPVSSPVVELYQSLSTPASARGHSMALGSYTPANDRDKVKRRRAAPSARASSKKLMSADGVGDLDGAAAAAAAAAKSLLLDGIKKGSKYCVVDGCVSRAKHARRCWKHGGSVQCKVPGCVNRAKTKGVCWSHGGGTICSFAHCGTISVSNGVCWAHGGGKRCATPGCSRPAYERTENLCGLHYEEKHGSLTSGVGCGKRAARIVLTGSAV